MLVRIHLQCEIERTLRVEMLESMFEVPATDKLSINLEGEVNLDRPWNIGLIVGPSGSGKTLTLREMFGEPANLTWNSRSVIDDFDNNLSMERIARVCQAVGFNTIPAWLRPYSVLSNGERFRAETARCLLSDGDFIVVDEFTSVVDRQVAQTTAYAVGKYIRENNKHFVAASCHYDIIEWLDPDWILEPGSGMKLTWRSLRGSRPPISVAVSRVKYETWKLFAPFHYMSQELNKAARCYGLFVEDLQLKLVRDRSLSRNTSRIASMCGVLYRPHPRVTDIVGFTRMVTLPDWQGLGLAFVLANTVASAYKALGKRLHSYPNHPAWIRSYQRSRDWIQVKQSGDFSPRRGSTSTVEGFGGKRCAVFMYIGSAMSIEDAKHLIEGD